MQAWLDWLTALPAPWLYGAIAVAAFAENVFPPLPADTVVALGAFVAARGNGTAFGAWSATMVGNICGAAGMFFVGRRVGVQWLTARFPTVFSPKVAADIAGRFHRQGLVAIAISRLLPAVRAVVPPVAGALGFGPGRAILVMALSSGIWYGIVCVLAFHAGLNADAVLARIAEQQRIVMGVAVGGIVILAVVIWRKRVRQRSSDD